MSLLATDFDGILFFWEKGHAFSSISPLPFMFLTATQRFNSGKLSEDNLWLVLETVPMLWSLYSFKKYDY